MTVYPAGGSRLHIKVFAFIARAMDETERVHQPVPAAYEPPNGLAQGLTDQIAMAEVAGIMS